MSEVPVGVMQPQLFYHWVQIYRDGRTAYPQFNPVTGEEQPWVERRGLSMVMWLPFSDEFAEKVRANSGTLAVATKLPRYELPLIADRVIPTVEPIGTGRLFWGCTYSFGQVNHIGEKPILQRRNLIQVTTYFHCNLCDCDFQWFGEGDCVCPKCGAKNKWLCFLCGALTYQEFACNRCHGPFQIPFRIGTDPVCPNCGSYDVRVVRGIVVEEPLQFDRGELRCPVCEERGTPFGVWREQEIEERTITFMEPHYVLGVEGLFEMEIAEDRVWFNR